MGSTIYLPPGTSGEVLLREYGEFSTNVDLHPLDECPVDNILSIPVASFNVI